MAEIGTQTAAIVASGIIGGPPYSIPNSVETWDGTSWTETTELSTPSDRQYGGGIQTQALVYGGRAGPAYPPPGNTANTEFWNGTSWTELNDLSAAKYNGSSLPATGSANSAMAAGGYTTTVVATTEEWEVAVTNKTITVS